MSLLQLELFLQVLEIEDLRVKPHLSAVSDVEVHLLVVVFGLKCGRSHHGTIAPKLRIVRIHFIRGKTASREQSEESKHRLEIPNW